MKNIPFILMLIPFLAAGQERKVENISCEYKAHQQYNGCKIVLSEDRKTACFNETTYNVVEDYFQLYYFVLENGDVICFPGLGELAFEQMVHRAAIDERIMIDVAGQRYTRNGKPVSEGEDWFVSHAIWLLRKCK